MGQVLSIRPDEAAVERAWNEYRALAAPIHVAPTLLVDRKHMEALTRAEAKWKRLYLAWLQPREGA